MVKHIVLWKFRPGTEAEQKQFLDGLRGLYAFGCSLTKSSAIWPILRTLRYGWAML